MSRRKQSVAYHAAVAHDKVNHCNPEVLVIFDRFHRTRFRSKGGFISVEMHHTWMLSSVRHLPFSYPARRLVCGMRRPDSAFYTLEMIVVRVSRVTSFHSKIYNCGHIGRQTCLVKVP